MTVVLWLLVIVGFAGACLFFTALDRHDEDQEDDK